MRTAWPAGRQLLGERDRFDGDVSAGMGWLSSAGVRLNVRWERRVLQFNHIVPAMKTMLGAEDYDEETGEGFSCYTCHPHAEAI